MMKFILLVLLVSLTQAANIADEEVETVLEADFNGKDTENGINDEIRNIEELKVDSGVGSTKFETKNSLPETDEVAKDVPDNDNEQSPSTSSLKVVHGYSRPFYIQIVGKEVYFTEYGRRYIHVLNLHGQRIRSFAIPSGNPTGLFVKGNKVLVTNHRREIYSFTTSGKLLGVQYAYEPVGIALDQHDLMYVTEWRTGRIAVFNSDGTPSHSISIGRRGYLRKIQFDKNGNLYVGVHFAKAIYHFNKCGKVLRKIHVNLSYIEGITIDPYDDRYIYVTERRNGHGKVLKLRIKDGVVIKTIHGLRGASDVAMAPDGKLWVVDFEGNAIKIYSF